jgi:hypothetical protein
MAAILTNLCRGANAMQQALARRTFATIPSAVGQIACLTPQIARLLESETLIGRGSQCALRLTASYASSQHAVIRWLGDGWKVWDLDSRNGTWLNGCRLDSRQPYPMKQGDRLSFGRLDQAWEMTSDAAPVVMVVNAATGEQIVVHGSVHGIPSDETPEVTLYQGSAGHWVVEAGDSPPRLVGSGDTFEAGSQLWRFCCPDAAARTETCDVQTAIDRIQLHFLVSSDEEYVELRIESPDRSVSLGNRVQNYLLLTLARARLSDRAANVAETSCGWLYKEDLVAGSESSQRVDHDVFRIRQHIATSVPNLAASIIERRPRTRQLRIGVDTLKITRV